MPARALKLGLRRGGRTRHPARKQKMPARALKLSIADIRRAVASECQKTKNAREGIETQDPAAESSAPHSQKTKNAREGIETRRGKQPPRLRRPRQKTKNAREGIETVAEGVDKASPGLRLARKQKMPARALKQSVR